MYTREGFDELINALADACHTQEQAHAWLSMEDSDFIRFNHGRVRQAGHVQQQELRLALIDGDRQCIASCDLAGDLKADQERALALLLQLRERLPEAPPDPYLNYSDQSRNSNSDEAAAANLPAPQTAIADIVSLADGLDLVGSYAGGSITCGFGNSLGQRNWHRRKLYNLDWSCDLGTGVAAKAMLAGNHWNRQQLQEKLQLQQQHLEWLQQPAETLVPGRYRVYLAPAAVAELLSLLNWGGFSRQALHTRQSPLVSLADGKRQLSPLITLSEQYALGYSPMFTDTGHLLPDVVNLIESGRARDWLTDARSGREYDQPVNAASESSQSLDMQAGDLDTNDILSALDNGLYISNLWYANYSDRFNCRITGLTRYACFRVERGKIVAPISVMRFDDSLYRILGDNLLGLTREREFMHDPGTYERRSLASMHLPGALVDNFTLTL